MNNAVFVLLVVTTLALAEAIYHGARWLIERRGEELRRRLRALGQPEAGVQLLRRRRLSGMRSLDALLGPSRTAARLVLLLDQAGLEWTAARFIVYTLLYAAAGVGFGLTVTKSIVVAIPLGVLFALLPLLSVLRYRWRRSTKVSSQLPEALEMLARSIRAGHALPASFRLIAQEMPPPVAVEFGKAFEQQNLGLAFEEAVSHMVDRVPGNTDLAIFAVSVLIQRETGGNLVENLEKIAQTIRERDHFYGRLRALTAEGRVSAMILGGLPIVVGLGLFALNPAYLRELFVGSGLTIFVSAVMLWVIGVLWLTRVSRVEF